MLEHFGAEASVLDMTIIVRSNPSKAAILEEFLHGTQEKLGIAEKLGRYGLGSAETHVKDFMIRHKKMGNDSNLLIVFYVQIMPDDFVMQLHRF
ncbi:hypothetical protein G917_00590 [Escherichia coli UMEA 3148-1]|nr:hypothetical protein G937_00588 [Escherichia coli UMEA 3199-1]ESP49431.1 hypothetical protein G917_00590 [Escherichia coli UMEA 3148-1]